MKYLLSILLLSCSAFGQQCTDWTSQQVYSNCVNTNADRFRICPIFDSLDAEIFLDRSILTSTTSVGLFLNVGTPSPYQVYLGAHSYCLWLGSYTLFLPVNIPLVQGPNLIVPFLEGGVNPPVGTEVVLQVVEQELFPPYCLGLTDAERLRFR